MDVPMLVGLAAGILTTIAFLPQLLHTWRTKSARDISLRMFLLFCAGVLLWLVYGSMIQSLPVMLANGVTLMLSGSILVMKLKWGQPPRAAAAPDTDIKNPPWRESRAQWPCRAARPPA